MRIDPATGNRLLVSGPHPSDPSFVRGTGPDRGQAVAVVFAPEPARALALAAVGALLALAERRGALQPRIASTTRR